MKYRIMIRTASGNKDQYQFLTFTNVNGEEEIWETDRLVELDKQVEKMLNGNYRKKDIQLVSPLDFSVFADVYDNDEYPPEPTPDPDPEPEPTPDPEPTPEPESNTEIKVNYISRSVIGSSPSSDPEHPENPVSTIVESVTYTANGENLPTDTEYTWTFIIGSETITKTSNDPSITIDDEDKDAVASATSVKVAVGDYISDLITYD